MAMVRVSGVQMAVKSSKKENLPRILEEIAQSDCDFLLFPEMSLTGHNDQFSDQRNEEAWAQIAAACRTSYCTAIIGTGARFDGHAHIQSRIYDDNGELAGTQEKLVPTEQERTWCRPGQELRTFESRGVAFGCLIGNDLWVRPGLGPYPDPRLSLQLGQKGAQIIFHAVNTGADPRYAAYHEANLLLRAREAGCYIVVANAAAPGPVNAPSGVVGPDGVWLVRAPLDGEQRFTCDLELD